MLQAINDKKKPLDTPYGCNAKAWMNSVITSDILTKLNQKFAGENRNVLLFLDNILLT